MSIDTSGGEEGGCLLTPMNNNNSTSSYINLTLLDGVFFKIVSQNASQVVAYCIKCLPKTVEIKGYYNTTSNFIGHLRRKHGEETVVEYKKYLQETKRRKMGESSTPERTHKHITQQKTPYFDKEYLSRRSSNTGNHTTDEYHIYNVQPNQDLDKEIVKCFINSLLPLRVTEDPHFINICNMNDNTKGIIINRHTICSAIENFYVNQMASIKDELQQVRHVCTTTEIWSKHKRTYLGVMAHYIDDELNRKSVALACHRLGRNDNSESITALLIMIHKDFDCCNKVIAKIADNSNELRKTFTTFLTNHEERADNKSSTECSSYIEMDSDSESDTDLNVNIQYYELSYISHVLSLCITLDVKLMLDNESNKFLSEMHRKVINKCCILWDLAKRPKSAERIYDVLGHTLLHPEAQSCSSLYESLKQIYNVKEKCMLLDINDPLTDCEYQYISEYLLCTEPMVEAINALQTHETCYYGILLPCLLALRRKLKKLQRQQQLHYCNPLSLLYLQSVERRFKEYFEFSSTEAEKAVVAALSYPKFKNRWFSCIGSQEIIKVQNIFKAAVELELNSHASITIKLEEPAYDDSDINMDSNNDFFVFNSESDDEEPKQSYTPSRAEIMILQFLNEPSKELDLLHQYTEIKNVFIKYNTTLPAPVQKMFLYETMINLPVSSAATDELIEKRLVLKANINDWHKVLN